MVMILDRKISLGNIVSWALVIMAFAVGYAKAQSSNDQVRSEVNDLKIAKAARDKEITDIKIDLAVIKVTVTNIDKKMDEMRLSNKLANRD